MKTTPKSLTDAQIRQVRDTAFDVSDTELHGAAEYLLEIDRWDGSALRKVADAINALEGERTTMAKDLSCQMIDGCQQPCTYVDNKGFIYCEAHGKQRSANRRPCRKMRKHEIETLRSGGTIPWVPVARTKAR